MKKTAYSFAVAAAMTLSVARRERHDVKLSEVHAEGYPTTLADQEFARLIEEKTEGRIKVEVFRRPALRRVRPAPSRRSSSAISRLRACPLLRWPAMCRR